MTSPALILLLLAGVLTGAGTYMILERSLTRILLGVVLAGNGINVLILAMGGHPGREPITDGKDLSGAGLSDPLPQAFILTAIVITFGVSAFLLAMIYRSWRLDQADEVADDTEDIAVGERLDDDTELTVLTGEAGGYDDTEFGDEAEGAVHDALDLDGDGAPHERAAAEAGETPQDGARDV